MSDPVKVCKIETTYVPYSPYLPQELTIIPSETITITSPYIDPTISIVLINPEFSDTDSFEISRVIRYTRGKTLRTCRSSIWPKFRRLTFKFSDITVEARTNVEAFILASLGQEVKLIDFNNQIWRGVISNPDTVFTEEARNKRSITIIFEGLLI